MIDDGISDLLVNIPQVRYFRSNKKIALGKKRNMMNGKCIGDIIVYMAIRLLSTNQSKSCC